MLEHLQSFLNNGQSTTYEKGVIILYQGEVPRSAFVLTQGIVRVYSISSRGDEQIVTYHLAGEIFPSSWIFGKAPSTLFFYEALTDVKMVSVPRKELIATLMSTPAGAHALLDYFTSNYAASLIRINALQQPHAQNKLTYTLYFLCQRYGMGPSNNVKIPLTLTHQNIANLVGLTRETTTTEINKLKKQGILTHQGQQYSINIEKLLELMGEESLRDVHIKESLM